MTCPHCGSWLVIISPSVPGPDGWARRCKTCGWYRDESAVAREAAEAEFVARVGYHSWDIEWGWNGEDGEDNQ